MSRRRPGWAGGAGQAQRTAPKTPVKLVGMAEPVPLVDTEVAHVARVYDYLLGGTTNFAVDREAAERVTAAQGGIGPSRARIRANRRFLGRVVRHLAGEVGIRQFLDVGTGIPNDDHVHGIAQQTAPDARVVYVDNDPIVLAHAHALLQGTPEGATTYLDADVHDPESILTRAAETLDLTRPVAVMLISMLHLFADDEDPAGIVARLMDGVPSGSYLAISHLTSESDQIATVASAIKDSPRMGYRLNPRSQAEISRFLEGLEPVDPGVVRVNRWHPDEAELAESPDSGDFPFYGALARKP